MDVKVLLHAMVMEPNDPALNDPEMWESLGRGTTHQVLGPCLMEFESQGSRASAEWLEQIELSVERYWHPQETGFYWDSWEFDGVASCKITLYDEVTSNPTYYMAVIRPVVGAR